MLDIIIICSVIFLILTFFYKQSVCEFRINQIEWSQKENSNDLLQEQIPLVIRSIPSAAFWTHTDVALRSCFSSIPIFQEMTIPEWLASGDTVCPWKYHQAQKIASASGIAIWAAKWMNPLIIHQFLKFWIYPYYYCWAGSVGLHRTFAMWTCIFPVDGTITVTIMPESYESSLPSEWVGCFPSQLTIKDTPFVEDLKYIDIILRPGNCLFMPPHWFVSWTTVVSETKESKAPMVCTIAYHTPISYLSFIASPYNK